MIEILKLIYIIGVLLAWIAFMFIVHDVHRDYFAMNQKTLKREFAFVVGTFIMFVYIVLLWPLYVTTLIFEFDR